MSDRPDVSVVLPGVPWQELARRYEVALRVADELIEELLGYALPSWDWKYGDYWREGQAKVRAALAAPAPSATTAETCDHATTFDSMPMHCAKCGVELDDNHDPVHAPPSSFAHGCTHLVHGCCADRAVCDHGVACTHGHCCHMCWRERCPENAKTESAGEATAPCATPGCIMWSKHAPPCCTGEQLIASISEKEAILRERDDARQRLATARAEAERLQRGLDEEKALHKACDAWWERQFYERLTPTIAERDATKIAISRISGALVDSGVTVPADEMKYDEAIRALAKQRDEAEAACAAMRQIVANEPEYPSPFKDSTVQKFFEYVEENGAKMTIQALAQAAVAETKRCILEKIDALATEERERMAGLERERNSIPHPCIDHIDRRNAVEAERDRAVAERDGLLGQRDAEDAVIEQWLKDVCGNLIAARWRHVVAAARAERTPSAPSDDNGGGNG